MQTIVLIMQRKLIAQRLTQKLCGNPDLHLVCDPDYAHADDVIQSHEAKAALIEATEEGAYGTSYCLTLCAWLKELLPACKLLLMCPEHDKAGVTKAMEAKREGRIYDFVFYDASIDYLASKLLSL